MSTTQQPETIASIAVTKSAVDQVRKFMEQEQIAIDTAGLRVSAAPDGCSGFRYWLNIEQHALPDDLVVEQGGLRIFLDESSARHLSGAEIDFVATVDASGFEIHNPNEPSNCGCDCIEECPA